MSGSGDSDSIEIDTDTCTEDELNNLFNNSLRLTSETAISLRKDYILFLDSTRDSKKLAVATSNASLHVFNLDDKGGFTELSGEKICGIDEQQLCGIRFASNNNNNLFVASVDKISLFDLRSNQKSVQIFQNSDASPKKLFTCFDLNADGSIICAGTEQSSNEAYLSFFDVRENSSLTTYTDSHQDDLTQVKFHSKKRNVLASGSTDGLINIFNISESCEDDALESSLNTESSIQTINWHPKNTMQTDDNNDPSDYLSCITHTNDFQFFDVEESELVFKILREDITKAIQRKLVSDCYVINSHTDLNGDSFLLAGSNFDSGQCLRSLTIQDSSLVPRNNLIDNKQIVRCSIFNAKDNILITGGENGIVSVWEDRSPRNDANKIKLKDKVKNKGNRKSKPY